MSAAAPPNNEDEDLKLSNMVHKDRFSCGVVLARICVAIAELILEVLRALYYVSLMAQSFVQLHLSWVSSIEVDLSAVRAAVSSAFDDFGDYFRWLGAWLSDAFAYLDRVIDVQGWMAAIDNCTSGLCTAELASSHSCACVLQGLATATRA